MGRWGGLPCRLFPDELDGKACLCVAFDLQKRDLKRLERAVALAKDHLLAIRREPLEKGCRVTLFLLPQSRSNWGGD